MQLVLFPDAQSDTMIRKLICHYHIEELLSWTTIHSDSDSVYVLLSNPSFFFIPYIAQILQSVACIYVKRGVPT